jgi:hypothetical protein
MIAGAGAAAAPLTDHPRTAGEMALIRPCTLKIALLSVFLT